MSTRYKRDILEYLALVISISTILSQKRIYIPQLD